MKALQRSSRAIALGLLALGPLGCSSPSSSGPGTEGTTTTSGVSSTTSTTTTTVGTTSATATPPVAPPVSPTTGATSAPTGMSTSSSSQSTATSAMPSSTTTAPVSDTEPAPSSGPEQTDTEPVGTSGMGASSGGEDTGSAPKTSAGCGSASPLATGNFTESIDGTSRKWMLDVPANYDASKPYRLIFVWHPLGGSGSQIVSGGFNGLKSLSEGTAIFATADGLQGSNQEASGAGWWNANGGDMKLVQVMLDKINAGLCVDQERIFSTGFSFGGMMSYTLPFEFDVFRAVAPCSGKTGVIPYTEKFTRPVPIMAFHGDSDTFVATALGKDFFDKYAERNGCGTGTMSVTPQGCVQYDGCSEQSIWCLFSGGHATWSEEPAAIWKFFSQY